MAKMEFPLSKLQHEYGEHLIDEDSGIQVFHAHSHHSLIQAAGYLKHTRAFKSRKGVFFRGQTKLYKSLQPSLLRGIKDGPPTVKRRRLIEGFLGQIDSEKRALRAVNPICREALLQHYGVRTTWLDVVDNIWVALWFACHRALGIGREYEFLHFEKRIPSYRKSGKEEFAYILLLESAFFDSEKGIPGHYRDARSETIDLRVAAPSQFVRPHAQHGILVRRLSMNGLPVGDCRPLHVGTIRVDLAAAIDWLGSASTLTSHSLFPPAFYDYGYRELLNDIQTGHESLGSIHRVQA